MSNKKILLASFVFLGLVIVSVLSLTDTADVEKKQETAYLPPISIVLTKSMEHKGNITTFAEIKPRWSANLKAHVEGEIIAIESEAMAGERVKKDAMLIRIENSSYKTRMHEAEQALAEAKLALLQAKKRSEQSERDWKRYGIKQVPSDLALHKPQVAIAEKAVKTAASSLEAARKNFEYTEVTAPFAGFITARHVSLGQTVSIDEPLLDIINDEQFDVTVALSARQWDLLDKNWEQNQAAVLNGKGEQIATAKIKSGGGFLDPETRQYKVFMEINNGEDNSALSGEFVTIKLSGISVPNTIKLPEGALTREGLIWYLDKDDRLRSFNADVIFHDNDQIVVEAPTNTFDNKGMFRIATTPLASFISGNQVKPIENRGGK